MRHSTFCADVPVISTVKVNLPKGATLDEKFSSFHTTNPQVYEALEVMTKIFKAKGTKKCSINLLFELLRFKNCYNMEKDSSGFSLSNSYRAFYSRMIMTNNPNLKGIFATTKQKDFE